MEKETDASTKKETTEKTGKIQVSLFFNVFSLYTPFSVFPQARHPQ
jgi:hypothetical protein